MVQLRSTHFMTSGRAPHATVLLILLLVGAVLTSACSSTGGATPIPLESRAAAVATTTPATSTPAPTPAPTPKAKFWPLTGLPAPQEASLGRRPLNVRLPNDPNARPQYGLNKADLVFELIVEGGVTRFSAIFQSRDADVVGPIRSYRWSRATAAGSSPCSPQREVAVRPLSRRTWR